MVGLPSNVVGIWTGGVCPGPGGLGGWGALLRYGQHTREIHGGSPGPTDNGQMQLTAAVEALRCLKRRSSVHLHTAGALDRSGGAEPPCPAEDRAAEPVGDAALRHELGVLVDLHDVRWFLASDSDGDSAAAGRLALLGLQQLEPTEPVEEPPTPEEPLDEECRHEVRAEWCAYCRPPPPGVLSVGYCTRGGRAYHNDPACDWLLKGHDRTRRLGRDVHEPTRVRWAEVATDRWQPCEYCCTDDWIRRNGHPSSR